MRISKTAFDDIIGWEVGSKQQYLRQYRHPEWPKGRSGVTIGIGYDLGYSTPAQFKSDWGGLLPPETINRLLPCVGKTGAAASAMLASVRDVDVPWEAAMVVYGKKDIPKWENIVLHALPNADKLPPDSLGALVSIAYNRGPSFNKAGDRYMEMRNIKTHMKNMDFEKIPDEIRHMKRIWRDDPDAKGLLTRRDTEAHLFERGLTNSEPPHQPELAPPEPEVAPVTPPAEPIGEKNGRPVVKLPEGVDKQVFDVQARLRDLGYYDVGEPDGKMGDKTRDAILVFRRNNDLPLGTEIDDDFLAALMKAQHRPVSEKRADADAKDLAPKNEAVKQTMWQKFTAKIAGGFAALGAFFSLIYDWIHDNIADVSGWIDPIKETITSVPIVVWWLVAGGIAVAIGYSAHLAQKQVVSDVQKGKYNA